MNESDLIGYENAVYEAYNLGKIKNPIHLSGRGNEEYLIKLFKKIKKDDWVLSTHRNHYHALLKSKNRLWLSSEIQRSSMHVSSKKYKFLTSSIVGGNLPIALGIALALKLKKSKRKVYCFTGDMAAMMGIYSECERYAEGHDLPIKFILECNRLGVETPTCDVWGGDVKDKVIAYSYDRYYKHHGTGKWVNF